MENFDFSTLITKGSELILEYGPRLILAILTLFVGLWIIKRVKQVLSYTFKTRKLELELQTFLIDLINVLLKALLFISVASMFGIETTSFVAIIGAAGLAVGLALQGSLANFAGGVLILLFKPFKVGDLIETEGHFGKVKAINIFVTTIITPQNKTAIVPNGPIANSALVNYSHEGNLRVDLVIGISYDSDIDQAKNIIMKVMETDEKVLTAPAPSVNVLELADSSVNLAVRPYATPADYWDVYFGITEKCKKALDQEGIEIPFPQRVLHGIPNATPA